ncbi:protein of unknown function [Bartonella clarridgeiae 73]|uniref:Uncharacterized protein n=1 Tax=Bartonella clarridgeiae (strain CCUG 45776 / CIP 104772 / 73) TaxID=696125 RepID=E6YG88_BARC7|nr:protein of unknown function [Bartonella clarridgeiae 73]
MNIINHILNYIQLSKILSPSPLFSLTRNKINLPHPVIAKNIHAVIID